MIITVEKGTNAWKTLARAAPDATREDFEKVDCVVGGHTVKNATEIDEYLASCPVDREKIAGLAVKEKDTTSDHSWGRTTE